MENIKEIKDDKGCTPSDYAKIDENWRKFDFKYENDPIFKAKADRYFDMGDKLLEAINTSEGDEKKEAIKALFRMIA